jgi:hypothetical protein
VREPARVTCSRDVPRVNALFSEVNRGGRTV